MESNAVAGEISSQGNTPEPRPEAHFTCPPCGAALNPLRARHVAVLLGKVVSFCSPDCRDRGAREAGSVTVVPGVQPHVGAMRWLLAVAPVVMLGGVLLGARISIHWRTAQALSAEAVVPAASVSVAPEPPPPEPMYGPEPPPADYLVESDRWVHPLPGPVRRLPERASRRFGAGRDHDSPDSCGSGHCGVDVGELKGELVLAAHDGVVERVVRFEGEDRGGKYVRLLHYGGRIVTQYMHLETVAAELQPGLHVRAGEPLGTVGDSGTKNSGPHLHFTFATRSGEGGGEVYVDPLALLTVWPLQPR